MDKLEEEFAEAIYDFLEERFPGGALPGGTQIFADDHLDATFKHEAGCDALAERLAVIARKQVEEAIVPFERAESECPFSKSRTPSSDVPCPRCAATSNEGCRLQTIAAYAAVDALRAALHRKGVEPK